MAKDTITFLKAFIAVFCFFFVADIQAQKNDFAAIDFSLADSIAAIYEGEELYQLPLLTYQLTNDLDSDEEKFRSIYTWVCTNIANEFWYYNKNKKRQKKFRNDSLALAEWNDYLRPLVFKKLMREKATLCSGYAYLIKEMAQFAELECEIVDGYGRSVQSNLDEKSLPNHSWNAVKLDGEWFLCDATWSAGRIVISNNGTSFEADYNDGYFLADPRLFILNHYPLDLKWSLLNEPPSKASFLASPIIYQQTYAANVMPVTPSTFHVEVSQGEQIDFKVERLGKDEVRSVRLILMNLVQERRLVIEDLEIGEKEITFYTHIESKGAYALHVIMDEQVVVSYDVEVKKADVP